MSSDVAAVLYLGIAQNVMDFRVLETLIHQSSHTPQSRHHDAVTVYSVPSAQTRTSAHTLIYYGRPEEIPYQQIQ
ncbi:hypothetical protein CY34DRAFT_275270 [Suillus luteus UH-Slu-Lm8-n1]|uniref:Uncharacterized protein n=1 Tax=Suillus luteus UH-Slu-Lm8-n1 TaxID=930992 RepID=A0A0D0B1C6_9AGAM|nr:hypothetical protein CY34DRAFT_275270 [Suillus luteus UH-Slu-Lm8-n1]